MAKVVTLCTILTAVVYEFNLLLFLGTAGRHQQPETQAWEAEQDGWVYPPEQHWPQGVHLTHAALQQVPDSAGHFKGKLGELKRGYALPYLFHGKIGNVRMFLSERFQMWVLISNSKGW